MWLHSRHAKATPIHSVPNLVRVPLLLLMFYSLIIWGNFGGKEFIYFQF
jgi:hypothetical protein